VTSFNFLIWASQNRQKALPTHS